MDILESFMACVEAQVGKPYVWGSNGPEGFDCSGLIVFGLRQVGLLRAHEDLHSSTLIERTVPLRVPEAIATCGAFLYMPGHIAVSRGDASTIEARNPSQGTGFFNTRGRGWTRAGMFNWKDTKMTWTGKMASPIKGNVSCEWRGYTGHAGIDIAASVGTPVYAAYAGTIEAVGWNIVGGRTGRGILIRNSDGEKQYYGHLSDPHVSLGQSVVLGEHIGLSGDTGNVTGPHLHFETWNSNGIDVNPRDHFSFHGVAPGSLTGQLEADSRYSRAVDGDFSYHTALSFQSWLKRRSYYAGALDGSFEMESWKSVQRWLTQSGYYEHALDGDPGEWTIKGLQRALQNEGYYQGFNLDGRLRVETIKALQSYLSSHL